MKHLAKYMHDVVDQVTEIWCDADEWRALHNATEHIDKATCRDCLEAAVAYGVECANRLAELPREQCSQCGAEILGHHSCQGVPGGFGDEEE